MPIEFAVGQLASQIVHSLRVDAESARWAAEAWAMAMDWSGYSKQSGTQHGDRFVGDAPGLSSAELLVGGVLRAFRGSLGAVGTGTDVDLGLCKLVAQSDVIRETFGDDVATWATVRFLAFTRRPAGLVVTNRFIFFLNHCNADSGGANAWSLTALQEASAYRSGLHEISLAGAGSRMNLEGTGIAVSAMLLFLDLIREVVGPFLEDRQSAASRPLATRQPVRGGGDK